MNLSRTLAGCLLVLVAACGKSPQEQVDAAQASLNAGDFAAARTTAEAALKSDAVKADKSLSWRLEKLRLDALAGSRQSAEITASLARLEPAYAAQLDVGLYNSLAGKLSQAHDYIGAIDVVHAGTGKFPDQKARFDGELAELKKAAETAAKTGDNAALEHLKSLGYL